MRLFSWLLAPLRWIGVLPGGDEAPTQNEDAAPAQQPAYVKQFQDSGERVRNAAKWLLTIFAAVAALLVAGTQFSSIGSLDWGWRLAIGLIAGVAGLFGAAFIVWLLLDVMIVSEVTIDDLERQARDAGNVSGEPEESSTLVKYIERNPAELLGFDSIGELARAYRSALTESRKYGLAYYDLLLAGKMEDDPLVLAAERKASASDDRRDYVQATVSYLVQLMAYEQLRLKLRGIRRVGLFLGAFLAAGGVGVFAWAVNPAKESPAAKPAGLSGAVLTDAQLTRANLVGANLRGAHLERAVLIGSDLTGANLTDATLRGADLRGAQLKDVTWSNTVCPDGTNSDVHSKGCEKNLVLR